MKAMTAEQLEQEVSTFYNNLEKIQTFDVEKLLLLKYFEDNEEILFTSPYATHTDISEYSFDGGYVCYVNKFIKACKGLYKLWSYLGTLEFTEDELLFTAYCCDLGKLSVEGLKVFVKNDNDWEVKKGYGYKVNPEINFMKYSERSLYILQNLGIKMLDVRLYLGVKLQNGLYDENNAEYLKTYNYDKSLKTKLPHLIHQAQIIVNNC